MRRMRRSDAARQEKLDRRLYKAVSKGLLDEVKVCIGEGAQIVSPGALGTPLHAAAANGYLSIALLLLECGAPANILLDSNYAPLHLTARHNHIAVAAALLNLGANLDITSKFEKRTPLHIATKWLHSELADLLLEKGAQVDCQDLYGNTPLHMACQAGNIAVVEQLLKHKADVIMYDNDGWGAMHFAASEGHVDVVRLLAHYSSPLDQQNKHGRTPLHWACLRSYISTTEALLALGANIKIKDSLEKTAKDLTSIGPIKDIIDLYESNLSDDEEKKEVTSLDLHLALKPFVRHVSRIESVKTRPTVSLDSVDSTPPELVKYITDTYGHDLIRLLEECFSKGSEQTSTERRNARAKYQLLLMAIGSLLSVTSMHVDTIYTTVSAALQNKIHTPDVLKIIFEKLQCIEDNLSDYQREISAEVRTLTISLRDAFDSYSQEAERISIPQVSHDVRRGGLEQGHFLSKVAHCLTEYKDCWRSLVPVLNPGLTENNVSELVERIANRSHSEMDRASTVLFSWQFYRQEQSLDTDTLLQAVKTLNITELEDIVKDLIKEYYQFTPLLHEVQSAKGNTTPIRNVSFSLGPITKRISNNNDSDDSTDC